MRADLLRILFSSAFDVRCSAFGVFSSAKNTAETSQRSTLNAQCSTLNSDNWALGVGRWALDVVFFLPESEGCLVALAVFKTVVDPADAGPR